MFDIERFVLDCRDAVRADATHRGVAEVVDRVSTGPLATTSFRDEQLRELAYSALLHDFGKVGVREDVLVKAKKLYPEQRARVLSRFDHMRTAMRLHLLDVFLGAREAR